MSRAAIVGNEPVPGLEHGRRTRMELVDDSGTPSLHHDSIR